MTSKQRANLRSIAQTEKPITQVGKLGVNDALIDSLDKAIEKRELIKITVLENSGLDAKAVLHEIAEKLSAEPVAATGRKLVLYRRSKSDNVKHIEF